MANMPSSLRYPLRTLYLCASIPHECQHDDDVRTGSMMAAIQNDTAFCTLGMFIIDEIDYTAGKNSEHSIIGGAGTYAALGARLAAGRRNAARVSWIVDQGCDFPAEFKTAIDSWGTTCIFRTNPSRLTTRAWNGYGPDEYRSFKYLTSKLRLEEHSLSDDQVLSRSFHMVCSPNRCMELTKSIAARRQRLDTGRPKAIFVWEPVPDLCSPEEVRNLQEAARCVDVISPNGDEVAQFFSSIVKDDRQSMIESMLSKCDDQSRPAVVVRDGADGSRLYHQQTICHLPAYHQDQSRVIDPTGGGNTFLGALALALTGAGQPTSLPAQGLRATSLDELVLAVVHGTIAASFAIEQVGVPTLKDSSKELWNDQSYQERFEEYVSRHGSLRDVHNQ